jgi:hypothetical protein
MMRGVQPAETTNNQGKSMIKSIAAISVLLTTACGSSAIVTTKHGGYYEGTITGGDREFVYVQGEAVPRRDITDVDHPGNVAAIIGSVITGLGLLGLPACEKNNYGEPVNETRCSGSGLELLTGVPIMIYGIYEYVNSTSKSGR